MFFVMSSQYAHILHCWCSVTHFLRKKKKRPQQPNRRTHLLGSAETHPHLEPPEEQLHHLVVLQVDGGSVQLGPSPPVVSEQHRGEQPQEGQTQDGEAAVEGQRGQSVGGASPRPWPRPLRAASPREQSAPAGGQQGQTGGANAVVAVGHRVEELQETHRSMDEWWYETASNYCSVMSDPSDIISDPFTDLCVLAHTACCEELKVIKKRLNIFFLHSGNFTGRMETFIFSLLLLENDWGNFPEQKAP